MILRSIINGYIPAQCRDIFGAGQIIGSSIGATADLANTIITNSTNADNVRRTNQANIDIANANNQLQREMNAENNAFSANQAALARQHDVDMADLQHRLNSPLELARQYSEAGFNPAVMMSGQSGMATGVSNSGAMASPHGSGISPSMPVLTPHINEKMPNLATGLSESIFKLAQASKINTENKQLKSLQDSLVRMSEAGADDAELQLNIRRAYGASLENAKLANIIQQTVTSAQEALALASQGKLNESMSVLNKAKEDSERQQSRMYGAQADLYGKQNETFYTSLASQLRESAARANQANASANFMREQGLTESALREARKDLLGRDAELKRSEALQSDAVRKKYAAEITDILEHARGQKWTNDQRIRMEYWLDEQIKYEALKSGSDYFNPFKFIGGSFIIK